MSFSWGRGGANFDKQKNPTKTRKKTYSIRWGMVRVSKTLISLLISLFSLPIFFISPQKFGEGATLMDIIHMM